MNIEPYDRSIHGELIAAWFDAWELGTPSLDLFPPGGFVADGMAAGFLYQTDAPVAIIDGLISDPAAPAARRNDAIDAVCAALVDLAELTDHRSIWAYTYLPEVVERGRRFGFQKSRRNYTFIRKRI